MKKVIIGFAAFLGFMVICTLISKSVYAYRLPMVSTCVPESKYIEHKVEAQGIVEAGGEKTVTYLAGLRIDSVLVHVGDRVEEGDALFQVDLEDLKELMEEKKNEMSKVSLQINAILENQAIEQQKREVELARAREDYDTTSRLQDTQVGRAMESYVQAENDLEENGGEEALKDALQNAAYGEADAKAARDEAVKQAQRKVEDLLWPEEITIELETARLEQTVLSEKLQEYQKVLDNQGVVTAPFGGVVTKIAVGAGERIPDTSVLLLSDESLPCQLKILLDKEQKKYISLGDQVLVSLEGKSKELEEKVDYLAASELSPEKYEAFITLPEGTGIPGLSGTVSRSESGEKYRFCIPTVAVHSENNRNYVYVLKEREGILGQEYYVDEINVSVIDKNDNWAAIEEGTVDKESKIILSATKEVKTGESVRWEE
ncbi:hypothetical protein C819_03127 [Lachnospiraceae bacterium 10-1]|jgi:multidrug efflux pump subunit AcrA (membrane-fusion protein)|nr:hypothetical protein C819_03127 [Lachnospiraceae bacterium 10-1]